MDKYKQGFFFSDAFVAESSWNGYENNCLFANTGDGQYVDVARASGSDEISDSRGLAFADFDSDGRLDLVINNNNAPPSLYMNRLKNAGHWVGLSLEGVESNRAAIGAEVVLKAGGKTLYRKVEAGHGFASQAPLAVHIGIGKANAIEAIEVHWPSRRVDRFTEAELEEMLDCMLYLKEGGKLKVREPAEDDGVKQVGGLSGSEPGQGGLQ